MPEIHIGPRTRETKLDPDAGDSLDDEYLLKMAAIALDRPDNYYGGDERVYSTHTHMFASAPDSDDLVSQSNYRTILPALLGAYPRHGMIEDSGFGHWTYSHYDSILIKVIYSNGEITPAFADALAIAYALDHDYPLYDESDYSDLEMSVWDETINQEIGFQSRHDESGEWSESFKDLVKEYLYGESAELIGYHDVGYIPEETFSRAVEYARDPQLRQNEELF